MFHHMNFRALLLNDGGGDEATWGSGFRQLFHRRVVVRDAAWRAVLHRRTIVKLHRVSHNFFAAIVSTRRHHSHDCWRLDATLIWQLLITYL